MTLPLDLVLVRHGESEGNVAIDASKSGDDHWVVDEQFAARHSSHWRLTELGIQQAEQAGAWIRAEIGEHFTRCYTSSYVRAMETAAHLGLPDARWYVEPLLRERERGSEDLLSAQERTTLTESAQVHGAAPLLWRPLGGESIADVIVRLRSMLDTLHRELSDGSALLVCHGEVMEALLVLLTRMHEEAYTSWSVSRHPFERIHNGQVWHFSRRDPHSSAIAPHVTWWRSVCTSDLSLCDPTWKEIQRPVYDNEALLKAANRYARLISNPPRQ